MSINARWITRTAVFIALIIVMQMVTAPLGNTLVTGSVVNLILIVSVMLAGTSTGVTVAVLSPIFAKFFGIGPFWMLIPFIVAGNITLVLLWFFVGNINPAKKYAFLIAALITASVAKFLVLYVGIVKIAVPLILKLPEPQAAVVSGMFSIPQLFTALIGGVFAIIIMPVLDKAVGRNGQGAAK